MLQTTIFILMTTSWNHFTLASVEERNLVNPDLDKKTVRFFCQLSFRTPFCPLACKIFPQFCQPETTTTLSVITTGGTTTTSSPTCMIWDLSSPCLNAGGTIEQCIFCIKCPERVCCAHGDLFVPGKGCPVRDYSCYVCQTAPPPPAPSVCHIELNCPSDRNTCGYCFTCSGPNPSQMCCPPDQYPLAGPSCPPSPVDSTCYDCSNFESTPTSKPTG